MSFSSLILSLSLAWLDIDNLMLSVLTQGGGVAERFKPLASKQEWSCRVWVRIPLMPRFHMPLIATPPRVSTGMAHFSIMWQGSLDIALMQLKGT